MNDIHPLDDEVEKLTSAMTNVLEINVSHGARSLSNAKQWLIVSPGSQDQAGSVDLGIGR